MMEAEFREESIAIAGQIKTHAEARGRTAIGFAVNWVLANPHVASVIAGPRTQAQWYAYLAAIEEEFDAEDEAFLDRFVPAGHPSTPGFTDPLYPVTGRPSVFGPT
jgi:aryl-alcohol dehydrogenase (NADP+)